MNEIEEDRRHAYVWREDEHGETQIVEDWRGDPLIDVLEDAITQLRRRNKVLYAAQIAELEHLLRRERIDECEQYD